MRHLQIYYSVSVFALITALNVISSTPEAQAEESEKILPPVVVQTDGPEDDSYVAKTSRTATKTATGLIETPQAVSVVTETELKARNVQSVGEAIRYSSGVLGDYWGGR